MKEAYVYGLQNYYACRALTDLGLQLSFMKCGRKPQCEAGQVSVCVLKCLAFKASVFPENKLELAIQQG